MPPLLTGAPRQPFGVISEATPDWIHGWALDFMQLGGCVEVDVMVDGAFVARIPATNTVPHMTDEKNGYHGRYGFSFNLSGIVSANRPSLCVLCRIANSTFEIPYRGRRQIRVGTAPADDREPGPIYFIHIPKTAGTSIRVELEKRLARNEIAFIYPSTHVVYSSLRGCSDDDYRLQPKPVFAALKVVFGHYFFGLHEGVHARPTYATVLRHPIARVISWYRFHQNEAHSPLHGAFNENPLEALVGRSELGLSNGMVAHFSSEKSFLMTGIVDSQHLDSAIQTLEEHFALVGFVDRLGQLMQSLGARLGIDLETAGFRNVNPSGQAEEHFGAFDIDRIAEHHRLDLALYDFARRRFLGPEEGRAADG